MFPYRRPITSMDFHAAQLLKEPVGSTRAFALDELAADPAAAGWEWVRGPVKLTRTPRGILVQGALQAALDATCSRCLNDFTAPLEFELEEEFFPTVDIWTGASLNAPEDFDGFPIRGNHVIDLTDAVQQSIILAQPLAPVCREQCAGLCPECGHDQNLGACGCRPDTSDPRWAALAALTEAADEPPIRKDG